MALTKQRRRFRELAIKFAILCAGSCACCLCAWLAGSLSFSCLFVWFAIGAAWQAEQCLRQAEQCRKIDELFTRAQSDPDNWRFYSRELDKIKPPDRQ